MTAKGETRAGRLTEIVRSWQGRKEWIHEGCLVVSHPGSTFHSSSWEEVGALTETNSCLSLAALKIRGIYELTVRQTSTQLFVYIFRWSPLAFSCLSFIHQDNIGMSVGIADARYSGGQLATTIVDRYFHLFFFFFLHFFSVATFFHRRSAQIYKPI